MKAAGPRRMTALMLAVGAVLLPPVTAFAGLARRPEREKGRGRLALIVIVGAVMWGAPTMIAGPVTSALEALQALLLVLCFLAAARGRDRGPVVAGILLGLAVMVLVDLPGLGDARARGWSAHANIWAAQAVLPAMAAACLARRPRIVAAAIALAALVALAAGSRGASLSLASGALVVVLTRLDGKARWLVAVTLVVAAAGLAFALPRSRALILDAATLTRSGQTEPVNLVQGGGEALLVERTPAGDEPGVTALRKGSGEGWARLQYPLILQPDQAYVVSVDLKTADPEAHIGLWGASREPVTRVPVTARLFRTPNGGGEKWSTVVAGPLDLLAYRVEPLADGWWRLELTIRSASNRPLWWWIGPTPDQREGPSGATLLVRRLQFELGRAANAYVAPNLRLATVQALARFSAFQAAWEGFVERPWLGWGPGAFADHYRTHPPGQDIAVPAHAHNALLQTMFERGLVGTAGLLLLLAAMTVRGLRANRSFAALTVALVVSGMVDHLFMSAGMLYVYAAASALAAAGLFPSDRAPATVAERSPT